MTRSLLALIALGLSACTAPPHSGVIVDTGRSRELGVSTRFGIVAIGAAQREGEVELTAFYGDGPATEIGLISPVSEGMCRIDVPYPTPWCEISNKLPEPGEVFVLAGFDENDEPWTYEIDYLPPEDASGLLFPFPQDLPEEWLIPGVGVYRWELDRWRLVGLLSGQALWRNGRWLVAQGPVELAKFVSHDHARNRPLERRHYRPDVRPR